MTGRSTALLASSFAFVVHQVAGAQPSSLPRADVPGSGEPSIPVLGANRAFSVSPAPLASVAWIASPPIAPSPPARLGTGDVIANGAVGLVGSLGGVYAGGYAGLMIGSLIAPAICDDEPRGFLDLCELGAAVDGSAYGALAGSYLGAIALTTERARRRGCDGRQAAGRAWLAVSLASLPALAYAIRGTDGLYAMPREVYLSMPLLQSTAAALAVGRCRTVHPPITGPGEYGTFWRAIGLP